MYGRLGMLALASLVASSGVSIAGDDDLVKSISDQLKPCAKLPGGSGGGDLPIVTVKFALKRDGHLDGPVTVIDPQKNDLFKLAAEASVRAVEECAPYDLPANRYDAWSEDTWTFDWPVIVGKAIVAPPAQERAEKDYARGVLARIDYARRQRKDLSRGKVRITVIIEQDGKVQAARADRIFGDKDVEAVMNAAIWGAAPYPRFSPEMGSGPVSVVDMIDFSKPPKHPRIAYLEAVAERIRANTMSLPGKSAGTALVYFEIDESGGVVDRKIEKTSGKKVLDNGALAIIDRAVPFPKPFPEALEGGRLKIRVPINFTLNAR